MHESETRDHAVARWVGWHLGELAAVGVPAVLALTVTAWLITLSAVAGVAWAGVEAHHRRARRELPAAAARTEIPTPVTGTETKEARA